MKLSKFKADLKDNCSKGFKLRNSEIQTRHEDKELNLKICCDNILTFSLCFLWFSIPLVLFLSIVHP